MIERTIIAGKRNIGIGDIGGMSALSKHLKDDGWEPVMVQTRSAVNYGYGMDEWSIYV